MDKSCYIVGIAGGSASGKTSFLRDLVNYFPKGTISVISQDNYYHTIDKQMKDEMGEVNFDLPTAIDRKRFHSDLQCLVDGKSVHLKEYAFNNPLATAKTIDINSAPIVVMEGLFVFYYEEIRKMLNLKVFIDAHEEIKLKRRILRDAIERGYPENSVRYQWDNHVVPSYKKFLRPYRDSSDVIITNNKSYDKGLEVLINHLKTKI